MKIKRKYFNFDFLLIGSILLFIYLKLIFSYLLVENSYWLRHLPLNVDEFNPLKLSAQFSSNLEYIILPLMVFFIFSNTKHLGKFKLTLFVGFLMILLNTSTSLYNNVLFIDSIKHTLKLFSPILFFICLIVYSKKHQVDLKVIMLKTIKLCLFLSLVALLFFNISMNRIVAQWPIYFANIHTHSYVIVSIFIGVSYRIFKNRKASTLLWFLILSFLILFIGYGVRTTLVLYLLYIVTLLYVKNKFFKYLWLQFLVITPVLMLIGLFIIQTLDLNKFSSGRLEMYSAKTKIIGTYNVPELLLGKGFESDLITTESWWYDEKGSHNDFITFLIENGSIYLILFVFVIFTISPYYGRINLIFLSLIIGYFVSSMISNGLAVRPIAGYVFFMVLAYIYMDIIRNRELTNG